MLKSSAIISLISLLSSLISLFNQLLIAKMFGASIHLDAYLVAVSPPLFMVGIIAGLFSYSIVPTLVNYKTKKPEQYLSFSASLFLCLILLAICFASTLYFFAPNLVQVFAPTLPLEIKIEATKMARVAWATLVCVVIVNYLVAVHNTGKRFIIAVMVNMLPTLGMMIATNLWSNQLGVTSLVWGSLAGYIIAIPILYFGLIGEIGLKLPDLKIWQQLLPVFKNLPLVLISMLCFTVYGTIDSIWASRLGPSNLSYLGYAQRMLISMGNIVTLGPWIVLTPYLTEQATLGHHDQFKKMLAKALRMVVLISSLLAIIFSLLRVPVITLLFQRGAFDAASTSGVASVLPGMLVGMVAMLCVSLIMKALHARGDVKSAAIIGGLGAIMYFAISGVLSQFIGLQGIVFAYAITWWLILTISIWHIWKDSISYKHTLNHMIFILQLFSSLMLCALVVNVSKYFLVRANIPTSPIYLFGNLIIITALGIFSFVTIIGYIFRNSEMIFLIKKILEFTQLNRRKKNIT
jgi:putative peptidoglycan lipid II flippase